MNECRPPVRSLRPPDAVVRRRPHFDPPLFPPIYPVADDAVFARAFAGRHVRLHRAGDAGKAGHEFRDFAPGHQRPQPRHHGDVFFTQGRDGEEDERLGH